MAPLVLKHPGPGGDEIVLTGENPLRGIESGEQRVSLLNEDQVTLSLESAAPLSIPPNSSLEVYNQLYSANREPQVTKEGENRYVYDVSLDGPHIHLLRVLFFDMDATGNSLSPRFSLTMNLAEIAQILFLNMAQVFSGAWGLGGVSAPDPDNLGATIDGAATERKTLSFDNENCLSVLQRICAEWETEFFIEYKPLDAPNRVLHIGPVGTTNPYTLNYTFAYGEGKGLYSLIRRTVEKTAFYTRAYVFGGSKNLPTGYRGYAQLLQIPPVGPVATTPRDSYVQDNAAIAIHGLIEGVKTFDEIYPKRTGTVSASSERLKFSDADISFDVNAYKLPGLTPKVHFQTGDLAGYEFDVAGFISATGTFTIGTYKDSNGNVFPSEDPTSPFRIKAGDTYVLIDLKMPDEYVTAAESKLLAVGQAWLAENNAPSVEYELTLDELFLRNRIRALGVDPNTTAINFFQIGDSVQILDAELGINQTLRVTGFRRDINNPYKYSLTVGDRRRLSRLQQILKAQFNPPKTPGTVTTLPADIATTTGVVHGDRPLGNAADYTLIAGLLPSDHTGIISGHARYDPILEIKRKTYDSASVEELIGTVKASGKKRPG